MAHQPFNLKNALLWAAIALGGFTFQACSSDDDYPTVDGQNPTISLTSDLIHAEPGRTFNGSLASSITQFNSLLEMPFLSLCL